MTSGCTAEEFRPAVSLAARLRSAARRRWRRAWLAARGHRQGEAAASAMAWLEAWAAAALDDERPRADVGTVAAALAAAVDFGRRALARGCVRWLLTRQRGDGGITDAAGGVDSRGTTGAALRGLLAFDDWPEASAGLDVKPAIASAGEFLAAEIDDPSADASDATWLAPLARAGARLQREAFSEVAGRRLGELRRHADLARWHAPTHRLARCVNALLDLGEVELARAALRPPSAAQRRDGSVPALPRARWVSAAGLAGLATAWFRVGTPAERRRADAALACLVRRQLPGGAWPEGWGRRAGCFANEDVAAVVRFLEAARWQVRSTFAAGCDFPAEIDASDGRLAAVLEWSATLADGSRIADIGCGRGRYLKHLANALRHFHLTGIDPDDAALAQLPPTVQRRRGELLRIPAADGAFDAAFCIEALEHALLPETAVDELCRAVRPGGSILVIDKHRARQGLSEHQPWERWFTPEEVSRWLSRHCDDVAVQPIGHGPHRQPAGLFFCWTARRRTA